MNPDEVAEVRYMPLDHIIESMRLNPESWAGFPERLLQMTANLRETHQ